MSFCFPRNLSEFCYICKRICLIHITHLLNISIYYNISSLNIMTTQLPFIMINSKLLCKAFLEHRNGGVDKYFEKKSRVLKRKHNSLLIVRRQDTCQGTCNVYLQTNKGRYRSTLLCIAFVCLYVSVVCAILSVRLHRTMFSSTM